MKAELPRITWVAVHFVCNAVALTIHIDVEIPVGTSVEAEQLGAASEVEGAFRAKPAHGLIVSEMDGENNADDVSNHLGDTNLTLRIAVVIKVT